MEKTAKTAKTAKRQLSQCLQPFSRPEQYGYRPLFPTGPKTVRGALRGEQPEAPLRRERAHRRGQKRATGQGQRTDPGRKPAPAQAPGWPARRRRCDRRIAAGAHGNGGGRFWSGCPRGRQPIPTMPVPASICNACCACPGRRGRRGGTIWGAPGPAGRPGVLGRGARTAGDAGREGVRRATASTGMIGQGPTATGGVTAEPRVTPAARVADVVGESSNGGFLSRRMQWMKWTGKCCEQWHAARDCVGRHERGTERPRPPASRSMAPCPTRRRGIVNVPSSSPTSSRVTSQSFGSARHRMSARSPLTSSCSSPMSLLSVHRGQARSRERSGSPTRTPTIRRPGRRVRNSLEGRARRPGSAEPPCNGRRVPGWTVSRIGEEDT